MKKTTYSIFFLFICSQLVSCTPITGCIIPIGEGCNRNITFEPNELPTATIGKRYYAEIEIKGGAVSPTILGLVKSENGLVVEPIEKNVGYNTIKIYGKPLKAEDTTILIRGSTYGTMVPGTKFEKTYVIKVKEAE